MILNEFLNDEELYKLRNICYNKEYKGSDSFAKKKHKILSGMDEMYMSEPISREEVDYVVRKIHKELPELNDYNLEIHVNIFQSNSGFNTHNDESKKHSVTLYLHPYWNVDYGGDLIIYDNDTYGISISPMPNRLVHMKLPIYHRITNTIFFAPPRVSLQLFYD